MGWLPALFIIRLEAPRSRIVSKACAFQHSVAECLLSYRAALFGYRKVLIDTPSFGSHFGEPNEGGTLCDNRLRLHDGPNEPDQFSRNRGDCDRAKFPFPAQRPEALMEPCYALQGNDVGGTIHLA